MLRQIFTRPTAGGNQAGQALQDLRILSQKSEIGRAAADAFQQCQQSRQRGIGVAVLHA